MMASPYQFMTARWWRFSRYEIKDGLIGPAPGAVLHEYDPWEEYEQSCVLGVGRGPTPPYQSFVGLDRHVELHAPMYLRDGAQRAVIRWCERYGLLGLLLQDVDSLPAGRYQFPTNYCVDGKQRRLSGPVQSSYLWSDGHWKREDLGRTVDAWEAEDLSRYFPGHLPLSGKYPEIPTPLSPDFWAAYREPVRDFMRNALWLSVALKGFLSLNSQSSYEVGPLEFEPGELSWSGTELINQLTGSIGSVTRIVGASGNRHLTEEWAFRSLLACLAKMIQRDVLSNGRVFLCKVCGRAFVSSSPVAQYCEPRCKNTANKRQQRLNKKLRGQMEQSD